MQNFVHLEDLILDKMSEIYPRFTLSCYGDLVLATRPIPSVVLSATATFSPKVSTDL